ncbi:MAG: hypothetical protein Q9186_004109 [Xanthomendoza sp. 1 TL-2023]
MPPFLVDTPASAQLRVAYVQSVISSIISRRIFQPFLFTYDHFDSLFNEWGECLRGKSTKREAIWRQRTLHAAFSCPSSKQRINTFAATVVDEVVAAIKPFADRRQREPMTAAVRKVVKTAAETWRLARIELSRITASPASDHMSGIEDGEALLSIFPRIERVPLPKDLRPDVDNDSGCVYTSGKTLFSTSTAMLARRVELGERVTLPEIVPEYEGDGRPDNNNASGTSRSSEARSHSRRSNARTISPLMPHAPSAQSMRGKPFNHLDEGDEEAEAEAAQQYTQEMGLQGEALHSSNNNSHASLDRLPSEQHEMERGSAITAMQEQGGEPPAGQFPMQSPPHSREPSPPHLSRRTTADTNSSAGDDEEVYEETEGGGEVPDWGDTGGNVPGAFGRGE